MNTKKRLNCYVFSNLMIGFLSLSILTNNSTTELVKKESTNTLNKIYEDVIESVSVPDTIIGSETISNVVSINNKSVQNSNTDNTNNYSYDYVKPSYNSLTGSNLVNYAKRFLGLRYVSAGRSLSTGTDCSGFTSLIYQEFGITLGRTVASQVYSGTYVSKSDLMPGDLVFYSYGSVASHVAIYMGDGLIIHESNPRDGVKISSVNIMNYITARRLITSNVTSNVEINSEVKVENKEEVVESKEIVEESKENIIENNEIKEEVKENVEIINQVVEEVIETKEDVVDNQNKEIIKEEINQNDKVEIIDNSEEEKSE